MDARIEMNRAGVATVQVYGHEYAGGEAVKLHGDVEVIPDGYDVLNGIQYPRFKPGKVCWRITRTTSLGDEITLFTSLDKPQRDVVDDGGVIFTWGAC